MVRTEIELEERQVEALRKLSSASGQSIDDLVRQSVDRLLEFPPMVSRQEIVERAMRAVGGFHSGLKDVSRNHDKYFAEAIDDRLR